MNLHHAFFRAAGGPAEPANDVRFFAFIYFGKRKVGMASIETGVARVIV
jgi:hypothetical protein